MNKPTSNVIKTNETGRAGHTPGPLEITYEAATKSWGVCLPKGGDVIAQLIEKEADAVLYAAAPELLEALELYSGTLRDLRKRSPEDLWQAR